MWGQPQVRSRSSDSYSSSEDEKARQERMRSAGVRNVRKECTPGMCVETSAALGDRRGGFCVCACKG